MRELKFRAWVGSDNTDRVDEEMHFEYGLCLLQGKYADADAFGEIYGTYEDVPVEQYTGFKDQNGKEIYEGDIVKQVGSNLVCPVRFEYGGFAPFTSDMMTFDNDYCEVIGNIHENPELLNEVKHY